MRDRFNEILVIVGISTVIFYLFEVALNLRGDIEWKIGLVVIVAILLGASVHKMLTIYREIAGKGLLQEYINCWVIAGLIFGLICMLLSLF